MIKKTLFQIIEEVKDGGKPDYDDLRYAVAVLDALVIFDRTGLRKALAKPDDHFVGINRFCNESLMRWDRALNSIPANWLGPQNLPENPERQKERQSIKNLAKKKGWIK